MSDPTVPERASALFVSRLQASRCPSAGEVRAVVEAELAAGTGNCMACVAQEAGDHPEIYLPRMRWALRAVAQAYAAQAQPNGTQVEKEPEPPYAAGVP